MLEFRCSLQGVSMDVNKKITRLEGRIKVITERVEDQKRKDLLRSSKDQVKKEELLLALRSVCPHEKIHESGQFAQCESGMRYKKWRTCLRCGLRLA